MSQSIRKIHVIFKTHLDVGYTDFAREVVGQYFTHFIPAALETARAMRERGGAERFIWTTGSWLIYEYLEQATPAERAVMEEAIRAGEIAWHALPFTMHSEMLDPGLFRFGLSLSRELDQRFNRETVAGKMTDVPGHTRGIVPLLAEAGVRFLHIGVNPASTPPDVPDVFRWRSASGAELLVMYQRGSYGDLKLVPGLDEAIYFAHTNDNFGPQSPEDVIDVFLSLRRRFPGVEICASTLDDFARALERVRTGLPVVTAELGDTWNHGGGTDPLKVARFRALLRARRRWIESGRVDPDDVGFKAFSRMLLLIPEHTWGMDEKVHLGDYENYAGDAFRAARMQPDYQKFEASWSEQRAYIDQAVEALNGSPLQTEAQAALAEVEPRRPDASNASGWQAVAEPGALFDCGEFRLAFDDRGAISRLDHKGGRSDMASAKHPLGLFTYQTFSQADYDRFFRQYIINKPRVGFWAVGDFTKPGILQAGAISGEWNPRLVNLLKRDGSCGAEFLLKLALPEETSAWFGGPRLITLQVRPEPVRPALHFELQWFEKPACRLPEALWLSFQPRVPEPDSWRIDKLGEAVDPLDVVRDGNRHLHACGKGVVCRGLQIESLDVPLVAPGQRSLLDFNNRQPRLAGGMHFLLYDNLWGTNFPMWYEDDGRFRFTLEFEA
jgi:hypothetical protein